MFRRVRFRSRPWLVSHGNQRVGKRAHPFVFFSERHYRGENQRMPLLAKLSGCISRASARLSACVVLLACLLSGAVIAAPPAPVAEGDGYRYYAIGDLDAARPGRSEEHTSDL